MVTTYYANQGGIVQRDAALNDPNYPSQGAFCTGTPSEKPEAWKRANVLLQVDKVKTPLLVMHGEDDPQVPPANSAEFVKALRAHNKTVLYFTNPNELHGFARPAHRLDAWEKQVGFLEHYINPKFGTNSTSTDEVAFPKAEKQTNAHNDEH